MTSAKSALFLTAALLLAVPAFAAEAPVSGATPTPAAAAPAPGLDAVIATVNGEKITKADLQDQLASLPPQVQQLPLAAIYPQLLEQMVVERIVRKAGYSAGLDSSPDVKKRLKEAEKKIVADEYLRQEVKKQITDAMLKKQYDDYVKSFKAADEARASHILVASEKEANDIIKQVKGGADFATLAKEKSLDKGAAAQGGDLGYFSSGQMVEAFEKAAFAMKPGDVSAKPVKTEFGYHIIKLVDKRKTQPASFDSMKPQLEMAASQAAAKDVVKELVKKADVQRFDLDGKPLAQKAEIKGEAKPKN